MDDVKAIKFEIVRKFGALSDGGRAWRKELNMVAWNEREPKLDIREWSEDHSRMGRGITLSHDEAGRLHEYLGSYLSRA
jgi:hypothetical protein